MAGPLDIQRFPKGLIELLGMRATGDTPHQLAQQISGDLPLKDEYLQDRLLTAGWTAPAPINAIGEVSTLTTVPPGFQWYVYGISGSTGIVAAAATIQLGFGIRRGQNPGNMFILPGCGTPLLVAGQMDWFLYTWETPMIMRPGDGLGFFTTIVTGAPGILPGGRIYYAEVGI